MRRHYIEEAFIPGQVKATFAMSSSPSTEFTISAEAGRNYDFITVRNGTEPLMSFTYDNVTITPGCKHGEFGSSQPNSMACGVQIGRLVGESDAGREFVGAKLDVGDLSFQFRPSNDPDAYVGPDLKNTISVMEITTRLTDEPEDGLPLYFVSSNHVRARAPNFFVGNDEPNPGKPYGDAIQVKAEVQA